MQQSKKFLMPWESILQGILRYYYKKVQPPQERETEEPIARVALNPQITFGPRGLENEHIKSLLSNLGLWDEMQPDGLNNSLINRRAEPSSYRLPPATRSAFCGISDQSAYEAFVTR